MSKQPIARARKRRPRRRGAVYVEFLVAFLPVFVFFLGVLQVALLASAKLVVEHAALATARSAAVIVADDPARYDEEAGAPNTLSRGRRAAVRDAALVALAGLVVDGTVQAVEVQHPRADDPGGPDQPLDAPLAPMPPNGVTFLRVRVEAAVACKIALVDVLVCGAPGSPRTTRVRGEALYPYQGARYAYETKP